MITSNLPGRAVYIADGSRTPFLKARGQPGSFLASDLALAAGRPLLARQPFSPEGRTPRPLPGSRVRMRPPSQETTAA